MKKIALMLVVSAFMFACGSSSTGEAPAADSTAVDTTACADTTKGCCVTTATTTATDSTQVK